MRPVIEAPSFLKKGSIEKYKTDGIRRRILAKLGIYIRYERYDGGTEGEKLRGGG